MYWDNSGFGLGRFYIREVYYGEGISFDLSSDRKQGIRMTAAEHANPFFRELHQIERAGFLEARRTTEGRPDEAVQRQSRVDYRPPPLPFPGVFITAAGADPSQGAGPKRAGGCRRPSYQGREGPVLARPYVFLFCCAAGTCTIQAESSNDSSPEARTPSPSLTRVL